MRSQKGKSFIRSRENLFCKKIEIFTIKIGNPSKHCGAQPSAAEQLGRMRKGREEVNLYPEFFNQMIQNKAKKKTRQAKTKKEKRVEEGKKKTFCSQLLSVVQVEQENWNLNLTCKVGALSEESSPGPFWSLPSLWENTLTASSILSKLDVNFKH